MISFDWTLDSPAAQVWSALTEPEILSRWLAPRVVLEARLGGSLLLDWGADGSAEGIVTGIVPGHELEYSWGGAEWPETSTVRWELRQSGDGVQLKLTHRGLTGPDTRVRELAAGWHDFLNELLAELGEPGDHTPYAKLVEEYVAD
jgi:uncharacterized protein YndB with AHSA1/START domain